MPTAVVPCPRPHDLATPAVQLLPVARTPLLTAAPRSATAPLALQALAAALLRPASPTAASPWLRRGLVLLLKLALVFPSKRKG